MRLPEIVPCGVGSVLALPAFPLLNIPKIWFAPDNLTPRLQSDFLTTTQQQ
jgi:hypothetical protein